MSHKRVSYASDVTDQEWALLSDLLPRPKGAGRPMQLALREVMNAILYVVRTGCQWRNLPHDFPCWQNVYYPYRKWCRAGTGHAVNRALVYERRRQLGRPVRRPVWFERGMRLAGNAGGCSLSHR